MIVKPHMISPSFEGDTACIATTFVLLLNLTNSKRVFSTHLFSFHNENFLTWKHWEYFWEIMARFRGNWDHFFYPIVLHNKGKMDCILQFRTTIPGSNVKTLMYARKLLLHTFFLIRARNYSSESQNVIQLCSSSLLEVAEEPPWFVPEERT